jgi:hypothetical protein
MKRKLMRDGKITDVIPIQAAKSKANSEMRILLATDETQRGQAATVASEERSLLAVE